LQSEKGAYNACFYVHRFYSGLHSTPALARYQARGKVKEMLRAQGRKVSEFTSRELALLAEDCNRLWW
jgi:hypothetical protein